MGIREQLNQKPAITTGVTIGIIVIAIVFILYQLLGDDMGSPMSTQVFYTIDDGKTLFADDPSKLAPFDYDGKQAVRAYVFTCDSGKTQFVGYLERITPEAKKKIDAAVAAAKNAPQTPNMPVPEAEVLMVEGSEVKKPDGAKWVRRNSPEGETITAVLCPSGGIIDLVLPD